MNHFDRLLPERIGDIRPGFLIGDLASCGEGPTFHPVSPIDGKPTGAVGSATPADVQRAVKAALKAFEKWRLVPAPRRGEFVRAIGDLVRRHKSELGELVCLESGKIRAEAEGEIQEWIDVCDYAVGLSRQLHGATMASERPSHQLLEQWHPLGPIGVISAFNFPAAVWAWNAMIALVTGDTIVWKPSEQTPLVALACHEMVRRTAADFSDVPQAVSCVVQGSVEVGQAVVNDRRLPLISATGSIAMGRQVAENVARRLGRSLLELGGNNAMIVTPSADLELAARAIVFSAVGTCGQRCTSLRRLIVHRDIAEALVARLISAYATLSIGDPRDNNNLVGPLVNQAAYDRMQSSISTAKDQGGQLVCGGDLIPGTSLGGVYVRPCIVRMPSQTEIMREETFAPLLFLVVYDEFEQALQIQNDVPQGLASAVFTGDVREAGVFTGPAGSDCGIANVNIGTSGAEIGGAFGGEKETGGGRESGSDSWKQYMRRSTTTINYGTDMPLAQGITFGS